MKKKMLLPLLFLAIPFLNGCGNTFGDDYYRYKEATTPVLQDYGYLKEDVIEDDKDKQEHNKDEDIKKLQSFKNKRLVSRRNAAPKNETVFNIVKKETDRHKVFMTLDYETALELSIITPYVMGRCLQEQNAKSFYNASINVENIACYYIEEKDNVLTTKAYVNSEGNDVALMAKYYRHDGGVYYFEIFQKNSINEFVYAMGNNEKEFVLLTKYQDSEDVSWIEGANERDQGFETRNKATIDAIFNSQKSVFDSMNINEYIKFANKPKYTIAEDDFDLYKKEELPGAEVHNGFYSNEFDEQNRPVLNGYGAVNGETKVVIEEGSVIAFDFSIIDYNNTVKEVVLPDDLTIYRHEQGNYTFPIGIVHGNNPTGNKDHLPFEMITVKPTNPMYTFDNYCLYTKDHKTLLYICDNPSLTDLVIDCDTINTGTFNDYRKYTENIKKFDVKLIHVNDGYKEYTRNVALEFLEKTKRTEVESIILRNWTQELSDEQYQITIGDFDKKVTIDYMKIEGSFNNLNIFFTNTIEIKKFEFVSSTNKDAIIHPDAVIPGLEGTIPADIKIDNDLGDFQISRNEYVSSVHYTPNVTKAAFNGDYLTTKPIDIYIPDTVKTISLGYNPAFDAPNYDKSIHRVHLDKPVELYQVFQEELAHFTVIAPEMNDSYIRTKINLINGDNNKQLHLFKEFNPNGLNEGRFFIENGYELGDFKKATTNSTNDSMYILYDGLYVRTNSKTYDFYSVMYLLHQTAEYKAIEYDLIYTFSDYAFDERIRTIIDDVYNKFSTLSSITDYDEFELKKNEVLEYGKQKVNEGKDIIKQLNFDKYH